MIQRTKTRGVMIGTVKVGDYAPIVVQSMCDTHTSDIDATVKQIHDLTRSGCDVIRVAVDSKKDIEALAEIRRQIKIPLIADIQFNYKMAIECAPYVEKFRVNPGHLNHMEKSKPLGAKLDEIVAAAKAHGNAIRIGINTGSLDEEIKAKHGLTPAGMVESALQYIDMFEKRGFDRLIISLKDSHLQNAVEAYKLFAQRSPYPTHLGVTEAGPTAEGIVKSTIAMTDLIRAGVGDTIRISLTTYDKTEEVRAGHTMLQELGVSKAARYFVSCPSCSRVESKRFQDMAKLVDAITRNVAEPITIAVMGCSVNGPGESEDADVGVWCGATSVRLLRQGTELGVFPYEGVIPKMLEAVNGVLTAKFGKTYAWGEIPAWVPDPKPAGAAAAATAVGAASAPAGRG
ncbi:MAG: flavodoxin-dependent (E)-4-hydroxy-3-methylbut-2-enyl-diphosphate synthase [Planctomycetes bacterium]|nr:flavodoxin-dependent (E)-4-hydroxy-3-methylbut-2-enyl-diphosphate synthase [Planctomycetota bacterium]